MSLKKYIKKAGGAVCGSGLLKPLVRARARDAVNVVYYHFVGPSEPHYDAFYAGCTRERFERDLEQLSRIFAFAPLSEVVAGNRREADKRPLLAVTFDDGFDLRGSGVMEALGKYSIQATTFVVTSCIDNQNLMWRHKLSAIQSLVPEATCVTAHNEMAARLGFPRIQSARELMAATSAWAMGEKERLAAELWERCKLPPVAEYLAERKPYFTWAGLWDWLATGHSVGFHTHTHPYCSRLTQEELAAEIIQPAEELKRRLGLEELCMSYPFGHRLTRKLEDEVFASGLFAALFGIDGFRKKGTSNQHLERAGIEQDGVNWPVFAGSLIDGFAGAGS